MNVWEVVQLMRIDQKRALGRHIGVELRRHRNDQGLKIAEIAARCKVSQGMLSKIENGQTSPSLEMLERLCKGLGLPLSRLFGDYDHPGGNAQHVRAGKGHEVIRRGTKSGHTYHLLSYRQGPTKSIEPFLVTMTDQSEVFPAFQHPGTEFIYVLEGELLYRHGDVSYELRRGDSLTFDATVAHGPAALHQVPIRLLSIFNYVQSD
jgi:transcriptional regulator with XRE-family HTH domain